MKDYYDIYFFLTKLKNAIGNTFTRRKSFEYLNDHSEIIKSIIDSKRIKANWNFYSRNSLQII